MDLRALRYFTVVVEAGSLSAAAATLRLSQPALSVAIGKLERSVGTALLVRSSRGVTPTSAGRYLLDASSRVLTDVDDIVARLTRFGAGAEGTLRLAAVPLLMWHRVPALLRQLNADAPDIDVDLLGPPPWQAMNELQQRRVDLAAIVVADPQRFIERHHGEFDATDWGAIPLVAALPPTEAFAPDPLPLEYFATQTMVMPQRIAAVPSLPETVDEALRQHHVHPTAVRSVETIQSGMPLIEAGLASAILPDPDRASLRRFAVVVREITPSIPPLRALVLRRHGEDPNPVSRRLLRLISADPTDRVRNSI